MKAYNLAALALALTPALAIPPDDFGFPSSDDDTPLSVRYTVNNVSQPLQPGGLFGIDVPARAPDVAVNETYESLDSDYTGRYFLLMVDPDASYPENPQNRFIIHWWQEGLTKSTSEINNTSIGGTRLVNSTAPRISYRRPRPPSNSSAHRYIFYLFEQPDTFQVPDTYSGYNDQNITRFPLEDFLDDAALASPIAANYFYCSNQTSVPVTFVGAPGSEYPGGNGAMVTQGENLPSQTVTGSSATPTGSATGINSATTPNPTFSAAGTVKMNNAIFGIVVAVGAWTLM